MAKPNTSVSIRETGREDLTALHRLFAAGLTLDTFSPDLLAEKLFNSPRPDEDTFRVFAAEHDGTLVGAMQAISRPASGLGWVGLFAVDAAHRRQGVATRLYHAVCDQWRQEGIGKAEALAFPRNYFTPGLDPRYTAALSFLERQGYEKFNDCVNLTADLSSSFPTDEDERRLAAEGFIIRRAEASFPTDEDERRLAAEGFIIRRAEGEDPQRLERFFCLNFGQEWELEVSHALQNDPPAVHVALKDDEILAFSAHSGQNREWGFFGPMGTTPATRGRGIGGVLLKRCLNDLRAVGHRRAMIPWVGPISFYARAVPCHVERVFWRYRAELPVEPASR
jgi:GNAT superfamily N-acetyltransferase